MKTKSLACRIILVCILLFALGASLLMNLVDHPIRSAPIFLYTLCLISLFTFLLFLIICSIKKMTSFTPYILMAVGLCGYLLFSAAHSYGLISFGTAYSLCGCLIGVGVVGSALTVNNKCGRIPVRTPLVILVALCTTSDLIVSFLPVTPRPLRIVIAVGCLVCVALIIAAMLVSANTIPRTELLTPPMLCCVLAAVTVISPTEYVHPFSPEFTLALLLIVCILIYGLREIIIIERKNVYLTKNMQAEIERQTADMQKIMKERENIMRFISHDMRKPVITMRKFIAVAREREQDIEQIKTIDIIDQKAVQVEKNLEEISRYAKHTYFAEQSVIASTKKIMKEVYNDLRPDCDANGILLDVQYGDSSIYVKPTILKSVLTNIIINAIEHASCTHIHFSTQKNSDTVSIIISDNGKGISPEAAKHMFKPYADELSENRIHGLGLYICKMHMNSMNGSIEYSATEQGLTFTVTLPKA